MTQVSFCLYLLNVKKDRTMFVSTCVIKWKASIVNYYNHREDQWRGRSWYS